MPSTAIAKEEEKAFSKPSSPAPSHRSWWQCLIEFVAISALLIVGLECFFAWSGVGEEEFLEPDPVLGCKHIAGKKIVWRLEGYSDESFSSQGLRDLERNITKAPNTVRVALLGDSATEGLQVPLKDTYGMLLQEKLNKKYATNGQKVEVINFGCSSYSNGQEMVLLEKEVSKYAPDVVILMYNLGDFIENIRDPSTLKAEPRPYFYINKQGIFSPDNTIMENNQDLFKPNALLSFLRNHSHIFGVLSHTNLTLNINEPLYSKLRNSLLKALIPGYANKTRAVVAPYTIQDPWMVTEGIFRQISTECKSLNSKFIVVCFPNNVNDTKYSTQIGALDKLAKEADYGFVDLTPQFVSNKDPKSLFVKYHFSSKGHQMAADELLPLIEKALAQKNSQ